MLYLSHKPAPPLDEYVENIWLLSDAPAHSSERIVPSGTLELVVNLREDQIRVHDPVKPDRVSRYSGAVVSGTYGGPFVVDARQHEAMLGVHFKSGGAFPFLGLPAGELADAHVDLQTLWGRAAAAELRERVCEAAEPEHGFRAVERALTARLARRVSRHAAVTQALRVFGRAPAGVAVRDVAKQVGLSQRRLIEVFRAEVGITPKLYCRVKRFQRAMALARKAAAPDWARLAVECGYCDQSHLIRDFEAFSGFSPTGFLRRRDVPVKQDHIAMPAAG